MQQTPFYSNHLASNAKIVDFGGWALPINYGSQIKEHEAVRTNSGMFDVSHMLITDISGIDAKNFFRYLICNDVAKLEKFGIGKALYSGLLNHEAGIIDDLIIYLMPFGYRLVTNAATEEKDMAWIKSIARDFQVNLTKRRDLAMLAVQGPKAIDQVIKIFPTLNEKLTNLKPFMAIENNDYFFARTGYTGENGLEIMLPQKLASEFWNKLLKEGVIPCGLGARDTLRLEAGMNLYGHDMNENFSPLDSGMDWVVDLSDSSRDFIGRKSYESLQASVHDIQVGLILTGKGVLREGQDVLVDANKVGVITSGTFSPTLKCSIAMARVNPNVSNIVQVKIRDNLELAKVVKLPFVRNGKILVN
jgi:aminomethyltransferase